MVVNAMPGGKVTSSSSLPSSPSLASSLSSLSCDDDEEGQLLPTTTPPSVGVGKVEVEGGGTTKTTTTAPATTTTTTKKLGLVGMVCDVWNTNGLLLLMVSCLCFSLMNVCAKSAERRLPALVAVAARVAFMLPVNTAVLYFSGIDFRGHSDTRYLLIQRGCFGFCSFTLLLQAGPRGLPHTRPLSQPYLSTSGRQTGKLNSCLKLS